MPIKTSVWANCSLKISDRELESWLLRDLLSIKYPGCHLKRGGFVQLHLLCPSACLQPVSQQLGTGCGFIHLNTTAAFKSWAGDSKQGKWSDSAKSEMCSSLGCGEEASSFPIASSSLLVCHCSFFTALSSFLHAAFVCKMRVSFVIQLNPDTILAKTLDAF